VKGIGVRRVPRRRTGHIGRDDMDFLAAETPVHLRRPHGRTALGREKEFGEDEQTIHDERERQTGWRDRCLRRLVVDSEISAGLEMPQA